MKAFTKYLTAAVVVGVLLAVVAGLALVISGSPVVAALTAGFALFTLLR